MNVAHFCLAGWSKLTTQNTGQRATRIGPTGVCATGICLAVFALAVQSDGQLFAHDGPDPIAHWRFDKPAIVSSGGKVRVKSRLGPDGTVLGKHSLVKGPDGESLFLRGGNAGVFIADDFRKAKVKLPKELLTISTWVSVDKRLKWGGIVGVLQDNGSQESGWVLGYNNDTFYFGLASQKVGQLTYMNGKTEYELGQLYHVAAVYDGKTMRLYVNGKLDAESYSQSGPIKYPARAPFTVGAYKDDDEFYGHRGRLREVAIFDAAAKAKWVTHAFSHHAELAKLPPMPIYDPLDFTITPYLQFGTQTSMTVMCRTNRPATTVVHYGETSACPLSVTVDKPTEISEIKLANLKPETQYFYYVESKAKPGTKGIRSEVATFQTAVREETPFAFAVISDTQGNPKVSGQIAAHAWGQRPSFVLHPGDLVSTGGNDSHWTDHFFPGMNPLIRYVPFYPVLGNHEQNAKNYFDYVSLPNPEYYYTFTFGNTQFFMIDSNRKVDPASEQYKWLDRELGRSKAQWKFVCHHHPPYSSDENDYGNLWKTNKGTRGDLRVRKLVPLYEKHNVDFVWNGHIHSYERTWAIRRGKAVDVGGPIYMITGGGGGGLETPGPIRPFFQNTVRRGHHYTMVRVNGRRIEIQAYDLENRLFDSLAILKREKK